MLQVRPPAVAGTFYPADAAELQQLVHRYLDQAEAADPPPKAIIAPHAGYVYSGPVAASAYKGLDRVRDSITHVVLLGPDHRVGFRGLALSSADLFATPLGNIPLDTATAQDLLGLPQVKLLDAAHQQEHSLEVHLPFLQELLGQFILLPMVVGDASPEEVAEVLERVWGGPETLIVISSDLSHYQDYQTARGMDAATSKAIEQLRADALAAGDACGRNPIRGLLEVARHKGLQATTVDLRNSGDTAGPKDRVVGYGAWRFHADAAVSNDPGDTARREQTLVPAHRKLLLDLARQSIAYGLAHGRAPSLKPGDYPPALLAVRACFVTLHLAGQLRGCIGSLAAQRPLLDDVIHNAYAAAFRDPRFPPMTEAESGQLQLSISVLSPTTPIQFLSEDELLRQLRPGVDGLVLEDGAHRGTFLPVVWEQLPERRDFLRHLKQKAGLSPDHWSPTIRVSRYTTESFG